jgi:hypothetical protein
MRTLHALIFLLLVAIPVSAFSNSIEPSDCSETFPKYIFQSTETICAYGDIDYTCPVSIISLPGGHLYVVPHGNAPLSGEYINLADVGLGYAGDFYNLEVMSAPVPAGDYDMIIDEHCDGVITGDDVVHECAFRVVGPPPTMSCPQAPSGSQPLDPGIASGSLCRGACGSDCPSSCTPSTQSICTYDSGSNNSLQCEYETMECGSHQGCRDHDDCYDNCANAPQPVECRRSCDMECLTSFGPVSCTSWYFGNGPTDSNLSFGNLTNESINPGGCNGSTPCNF